MKIALASPPFPSSIQDGLTWTEKLVKEAAEKQAVIICFPESFIPGYPGMGYVPAERTAEKLQRALERVCVIAAENRVAIVMPMDWYSSEGELLNVAFVIDADGQVLGYQSKNQLDPTEESYWVPGTERRIFLIDGVKIGITICHEGFRYPESVRWAAQQGAQIVFHPQFVASDVAGALPVEWGSKGNSYHEKATMMRAMENTIFVASSNFADARQLAASALITPEGECLVYGEYGVPGVVV
uniref:carbon-nitrogen hydrolase family protein n=1 Tax=Chitinophaga sp. TaxID=1869181 RepID=UPI0031E30F33